MKNWKIWKGLNSWNDMFRVYIGYSNYYEFNLWSRSKVTENKISVIVESFNQIQNEDEVREFLSDKIEDLVFGARYPKERVKDIHLIINKTAKIQEVRE